MLKSFNKTFHFIFFLSMSHLFSQGGLLYYGNSRPVADAGPDIDAVSYDIIELDDLETVLVAKKHQTSFFSTKQELVGRKLKQNVSLGFPIRSRHLHLEWVINKGDKIDIIQSAGGINISASGVALENGQKGEKIKVMNLSSEKNLVAWVLNEKKVTTQTNINRN